MTPMSEPESTWELPYQAGFTPWDTGRFEAIPYAGTGTNAIRLAERCAVEPWFEVVSLGAIPLDLPAATVLEAMHLPSRLELCGWSCLMRKRAVGGETR
jgi:hypothetical protein